VQFPASRYHPRSAAFAAAGLVLAGQPAGAVEYCVTCAAPAAMYACTIEGAPPDGPSDPRAQLFCIQELARQGGHETCSVPRSAPSPCPGVMRVVAAPGLASPVAVVPPSEPQDPSAGLPAAEDAVPVEPAAAGKGVATAPKPKEPRTVEELASQTVDASKKGFKKAGDAVTGTAEKAGQGVEKAGSAVGTAAKKTWHCLTSFFSEC
jgi:hypothetical protein